MYSEYLSYVGFYFLVFLIVHIIKLLQAPYQIGMDTWLTFTDEKPGLRKDN